MSIDGQLFKKMFIQESQYRSKR